MSQKHGPWIIQHTTRKYRNEFIEVCEDQVIQPDGQPGEYATVSLPPGVAILAVDDEGNAYLARQFRYALGQDSTEVISGGLATDEPPRQAAEREAREELGIEAGEWHDLGLIHLDTSIVQCPVHLFLATRLTFTEAHREGTETIEPIKIRLERAVEMVMDSEITHTPSCVLILKAWRRMHSEPFSSGRVERSEDSS